MVCEGLAHILDSLVANFDPAPFQRQRDAVTLRKMVEALQSPTWRHRFDLVSWFTSWLGRLTSWVGGCSCHEHLLVLGQKVDCHRKGRRLPEAYDYGMNTLRSGLREANSWSPEFWRMPGDHDAQVGCVRSTFLIGARKFHFLDRLPWLLCRLDRPGVRDRVLAQWLEVAPERHHRVTRNVMALFLADLTDIDADGNGISPRLRTELDGWAGIPLDDTVAESPHARAKKVTLHARHAGLPWVAATTRMTQNLRDARTLPAAVGRPLLDLWANYKSILQNERSRRPHANVRQSVKNVCADVYTLGFARGPKVERYGGGGDGGLPDEGDGGGEDGGGGGGAGGAGEGGDDFPSEEGGDGGDDDSDGADGAAPGGMARRKWRRDDQEVILMRQYLAESLELNGNYTIRVPSPDDPEVDELVAFQILSMEHRPMLISTFEDDTTEKGLFNVGIQIFEIWRAPRLVGDSCPKELDVFIFEDPVATDLLAMAADSLLDRSRWLQWRTGVSDTEGCILFDSPTDVRPKHKMQSDKVPVLSLLDSLAEQGFIGHEVRVWHGDPGATKKYDRRNISRQRRYLQCVLCQDALIAGGMLRFPSGAPQVLYELLLRSRKEVPLGKTAKEYRTLLKSMVGTDINIACLDRPPPAKRLKLSPPAAVAAAPIAGCAAASDSDVAGDEPVVAFGARGLGRGG